MLDVGPRLGRCKCHGRQACVNGMSAARTATVATQRSRQTGGVFQSKQFQVTWASSLLQARLTAIRNLREAPDPSATPRASRWRRRRKENSAAPSNRSPSTKVNDTMRRERLDGRLRKTRRRKTTRHCCSSPTRLATLVMERTSVERTGNSSASGPRRSIAHVEHDGCVNSSGTRVPPVDRRKII